MKVFYALLVFTVLEYFYAKLANGLGFSLGPGPRPDVLAVIKATPGRHGTSCT